VADEYDLAEILLGDYPDHVVDVRIESYLRTE
jgi:hypothetical protein